MKRYLLATLFLLPILFSSGCWDKREVEEKAYVVVIGLDKHPDHDTDLDVTFQIANPQVGSSQRGSQDNEEPSEIITFPAIDMLSARDTANAIISRKITFEHITTIIVSEELAKSDIFYRVLYPATRDRELRREARIIVSKEKASDFIKKNKPVMETRPHKYYQFMFQRTTETGLIPDTTVHDFSQCTEGDADLVMTGYTTIEKVKAKEDGFEDDYYPGQIVGKNKQLAQMIGAAVFKEGKMVGELTGEELRLAIELNPYKEVKSMMVSYPDPMNDKYRIIARRYDRNLKVKMDLKGTKPKINVTLNSTMDILGIPSFIAYTTDLKKQQQLERAIEKGLKKKFEALIKKTQEDFKGQPFCWSIPARKEFLTMDEYIEFDWMKTYPEIEVKMDVNVAIKSFGKNFGSPRNVRD